MKALQIQLIATGTPAYEAMVALRLAVLLLPIGIPRSYINEESEANDLLLGAYVQPQLVGCCILTKVSDTTVQLRQMAVEPDFQGRGVGAALLRFAEDLAAKKGYQFLLLHAREGVVPFYEKSGYSTLGRPFFEVGIGHFKMQKALPPGALTS